MSWKGWEGEVGGGEAGFTVAFPSALLTMVPILCHPAKKSIRVEVGAGMLQIVHNEDRAEAIPEGRVQPQK